MARQLTFDLARDPAFDAEDFLVAPSNADAFALLDRWPRWTSRVLIVTGPPGSGKSHLAAMWARQAKACAVRAGETIEPERLATHAAVLLEDCDRSPVAETALFHFVNLMRDRDGFLVMTARRDPDHWGLRTADLLSRLRLAVTARITSPSPGLMRAVLIKLFDDRQIRIEEDIVTYATLHLDQSLDAVVRFVDATDLASLSSNRRITRQLASQTIATLRSEDLSV